MPRWDVRFDMRIRMGDIEVVRLTARADALASVIRAIPVPPHIQQRLDRLNIIRAVQGTTGIEGTELSEEEVAEILSSPSGTARSFRSGEREEQEVRNAEALMLYVADALDSNPSTPLGEGLIRRFHEILTRKIDYEYNIPGQYRSFRVTVGSYVPPETGDDVRRLMADFIRWFNTGAPTRWHPIVRAIIAHFYVVSIHPFGDGNGRTSRAVESYLLYQAGINARGFYSLSNYCYRNRADYVHYLNHVRFYADNDLTPFVLFALRGLVEELESVHEEVLAAVRIIAFRDYARELIFSEIEASDRVRDRLFRFLMLAIDTQPVSLRALRSRAHPIAGLYNGMTTRTIMRDVRLLQQRELVKVEGDLLRPNMELMVGFTS